MTWFKFICMFPVELMVNLNFDRYFSLFQGIERKAILQNELDEKETFVETVQRRNDEARSTLYEF